MQTSYRFLLAVHFPWIYSQKLVNNMGILSRRLKFMTAYFLRKRQLLLPFDNFFSWVLITSNSNLLSVTLASCCLQCGWQKTKWDYEAYCDNFCRSSFWILDRCILSHIVINKGADFILFFSSIFRHLLRSFSYSLWWNTFNVLTLWQLNLSSSLLPSVDLSYGETGKSSISDFYSYVRKNSSSTQSQRSNATSKVYLLYPTLALVKYYSEGFYIAMKVVCY